MSPPPTIGAVRRTRLLPALAALVATALASLPAHAGEQPAPDRVQITLDTSEAEAVLAIVDRARGGAPVDTAAWAALFASRPYVRLKRREAGMHREFSDEQFRAFVLSPALAARADSLHRTLEAWRATDLSASARRVLAYLPDSARIRTAVYPVIKPITNSFVFEAASDPAIFLYLDPTEPAARFENTVAHEMHHIGFSSLPGRGGSGSDSLPVPAHVVVQWLGAFGEGFAMLAAAGGPHVHPHAASPPAERARWDHDVANFDRDLVRLERFFLDVLDGRLKTEEEINKAAFEFFGIQGPWYTVGWRMAVVVEERYGRAALIECMREPRTLLARYDEAAAEANARDHGRRALWSRALLERIGAR